MGAGFPKRLVRSALGPKLRNNYPVEHPEGEIGDTQFNALFWNVAGMGLVLPRGVLVASWTGAAFVISHQAEAWNPENDQPHPVLARAGTGNYTYTLAASYLDEDGSAVAPDIKAAWGQEQRIYTAPLTQYTDLKAWIDPIAPLVIQIRNVDVTAGALADYPFILWFQ